MQALATMFTDITGAPDAQGFQDTLKKVRSVAVDGAAAMAKVSCFLVDHMPNLSVKWRDTAHAVRTLFKCWSGGGAIMSQSVSNRML